VTPPNVIFVPAPVAPGFLQEITWTMTGATTASVSSTGLDIIWNTRATLLAWQDGQPRFFHGTEALSGGATGSGPFRFPSAALARAWWDNYRVEVRFNGGSWEDMGDPVSGNTTATALSTSATTSQTGTAFVSGDIVDFRVSSAS
jgi:hypothetical protein